MALIAFPPVPVPLFGRVAGGERGIAKRAAGRNDIYMIEGREHLGELKRRILQHHERLIVLRRFADLPGEYLVVLVERGLLSASADLRSRYWNELALAVRELDSVQRYLRHCREDVLRSCGSVRSSWEVMSDSWNRLIQDVESFKNARKGFLEIEERVRAVAEKFPEGFSGRVENPVASKSMEIPVPESDPKKVREAVEQTRTAIEKLEGELEEMETEKERLVRRLRDDRQQS